METCFSGPKLAVLHPESTDEGWGPIETSNCDANHSVLIAQNDR